MSEMTDESVRLLNEWGIIVDRVPVRRNIGYGKGHDMTILGELVTRDEMICGVYCITHKSLGLKYIGQTNDIWRRYGEHCRAKGNKSATRLHDAIKQYGLEMFTFELLEDCGKTLKAKLIAEREYIEKYGTYCTTKGYNMRGSSV